MKESKPTYPNPKMASLEAITLPYSTFAIVRIFYHSGIVVIEEFSEVGTFLCLLPIASDIGKSVF